VSRLPRRLQPLWPIAKAGHRLLAQILGYLFRFLSRLLGARGVPTRATHDSESTARLEPDTVTVHPAGPAEQWTRRAPMGAPAHQRTFQQALDVRIPARYTLEVTRGRLSGDFAATITPGKVLDYQVSGYFGISGWREHPLYLRPTLGSITRIPGTTLSLTARGASSNYYHFLYDAIGRYGVFEESMPGVRPDIIVVPHQLGYQRQLLAMLGIDARLVQPRPGNTFQAERLLVPSTPNQDLDAPRSVTRWLRRHLPASASRDLPRRLYITRGQVPNTRRYLQEPELWPLLDRRGFTRVDPGTLSVQDQIDLFHGAEAIVAPHGAGLTNLTFCQPGARVLEMFAPRYVHMGLWAICESIGDIDYRCLIGEGRSPAPQRMTGVLDDISMPVRRVEEAVDDLLA
jgi:hypothetical protein